MKQRIEALIAGGVMPSHTERGKAFQVLCAKALRQALNRDFDLEVPISIGPGKPHFFDLATPERDIIVECKAFTFTASGNNPSAKITTLREAASYLRAVKGDVQRLLIVKRAPHPKRGETLGRYFVRLNINHLDRVTVLEMPESGGDLQCIHGTFHNSLRGSFSSLSRVITRIIRIALRRP
jgi:hypothetical protein